jgi:hypothetical protein
LEGMCKDTEEPNPVQHMYVWINVQFW